MIFNVTAELNRSNLGACGGGGETSVNSELNTSLVLLLCHAFVLPLLNK